MGIAANAPAPQQYQPHQDLYLAQRQALNQPLVADVPGIAQWYAALHAQQAAQGLNPGVTIHQAREAQVLMEQERLLAYQAQVWRNAFDIICYNVNLINK